ncbi:MAG TPA: hypothetical protein VGL65_02305 [Gemmatimonadales bacterium]
MTRRHSQTHRRGGTLLRRRGVNHFTSNWEHVISRMLQQRPLVAGIAAGAIALALAGVWLNRWHLGRAAVRVADPMIRSWVEEHVLTSSDSAYHLTMSPIRFDEASRTLAIDTITVVTDSVANQRLRAPHPRLTLDFHRCIISGIDLDRLTAGGGLHAVHAGCDSMALVIQTLVAHSASTANTDFLRFQGKIDLPASVPSVALDALTFPHVHVAFDLIGSGGTHTALAVDSLAAELDAFRIDPRQPVAKRRPLFSQNIYVRLDRFEGITPSGARLALRHFSASLDDGTCRLDSLTYAPEPGDRANSLGFAALRAQHVMLSGVAWRPFLLSGDATIGLIRVDTVGLRIVAPQHVPTRFLREIAPTTLETTLRAVGSNVRLDSLVATSLTVIEAPQHRSDSIVTTVRRLTLGRVAFGSTDSAWSTPFPIGEVTARLEGLVRRAPRTTIVAAGLSVDANAKRITADAVHAAPEGDDAAFEARTPYQKSRLSVSFAHAIASGIDLPAYLRRGALRARRLEIHGLLIDVFKDKSKPQDPAPDLVRRTPQQVLHDAHVDVAIDTAIGDGEVTYREWDAGAPRPGVLVFAAAALRGYNFSTEPERMSAQRPFRMVADAKLMGAGPLHVEWDVPLLASDFEMQWQGSLGSMDPRAMNSFLANSVGMRFTGGKFAGAEWDAVVRNGRAVGKLVPRWRDLHVELPGVARNDSSVVGGLKRGFAKLAANVFGIRGSNDSGASHRPIDASITHQWVPIETLPQFIWFQLRDPLLLILKK